MTASERRRAIFKVLCQRGYDTRANLAFEFGVSKRTIEYDIRALSLAHYPVYAQQGNGGGIYVMEGIKISEIYLTDKQSELMKRVMGSLTEEKDIETMKSILKLFR